MIFKNPVPQNFPDDGYNVSDAEMSRRRRAVRARYFQEAFDLALDACEQLGLTGQEAEDFLQNERIVISWELDKTGL